MLLLFQRSKFIRKPLGGSRSGTTAVIPDSEYRNLSTLLETEAERNRILARNGFSTNASSELRSDSITPGNNQNRTLSASGQRKNTGRFSFHITFSSAINSFIYELVHSISCKTACAFKTDLKTLCLIG